MAARTTDKMARGFDNLLFASNPFNLGYCRIIKCTVLILKAIILPIICNFYFLKIILEKSCRFAFQLIL